MKNEIETQVAKVLLGNFKQSTTYVSTLAENSQNSLAELYMVMELPLFNPAAIPDCERITKAVASALRRSFRGETNDSAFENALAHINEELSKLVNIGQANWSGKLSALIAVKFQDTMYIATTGKIVAMMLRGNELVSLADSPKKIDPAHTFENFATGKIRLGDLFLFSTTSFFNYISVDKFKQEAQKLDLPKLAEYFTNILQETASPEAAFGTLMVLQVEAGTPLEFPEHINYLEPKVNRPSLISRLGDSRHKISYIATKIVVNPFLKLVKLIGRKNDIEEKESIFSESEQSGNKLIGISSRAKEFISSAKVKYNSKNKKIFLISAVILLIALIVNITLTKKINDKKTVDSQMQTIISTLETKLNDMEGSLLYNDRTRTLSLLKEFEGELGKLSKDSIGLDKLAGLNDRLKSVKDKLDKNIDVTVTDLGTFATGENLVEVPNNIIAQSGETLISYDKSASKIEENKYKCPEKVSSGIYWKESKIFVYNSQNFLVCNLSDGSVSGSYSGLVPAEHEFAALGYFGTSNKVYSLNKALGQITSYEVDTEGPVKPKVWLTDEKLKNQISMAIDGSIYTYGPNGINKYLSSKQVDFNSPDLFLPISGKGKIYTNKDTANIYLIDRDNNRFVVMDKKGGLVATMNSKEFNNMIDFSVDEKSKTIYLLNSEKLLKIVWK